ncbi:GNAT family N-acetyltransferase [Bacillus sp. FSL K6-3431]|uniref:GNAT family N-acetyltransferase n=1 Tax=Bacillus sp. FSL K6-3431 TaxID=2921500 RepID=UPI0030F7EF79
MKLIQIDISRIKELVTIWNDELAEQFPMREELLIQNSVQDENVFFPGSQMAINEDDELLGFIVSKRWQEELPLNIGSHIGWIQVLLVRSKYRNQGIGTFLLEHAESALKKDGASEILLGRDPWHYFPGIPTEYGQCAKWFERKGYKCSPNEYDLIAEYDHTDVVVKPEIDEVEAVILTEDEQDVFLQFLHRVFPGRWEYEAIHYFKKGGTGREFVVLKKDGNIIGFCRINDSESPMIAQNVYWAPIFAEPLGGIGPLGIDQNERGNGYGLAVVQAGIYFLRTRNIKRIAIDWTGLVDFYGKLDYQVWKGYQKYSKQLGNKIASN